jgi:PilZ domain
VDDSNFSGVSPDSGESADGADYLRRLKGPVDTGSTAVAVTTEGSRTAAETANQSTAFKERRRAPRFRCSGSAEFRAEGTTVPIWGTLTDVGLHGCYVEMSTTFPVGTVVNLVLKSMGIRMETSGIVRATYPSLGMGVAFADIPPDQLSQLKQLLSALTGRTPIRAADPGQDIDRKDGLSAADPKLLVDEIALFFQTRTFLSQDDFYKIGKRVRRS